MIEKYYNGVVEQVYSRLGKVQQNIVMAQYSNDFSISDLEKITGRSDRKDPLYVAYHEFQYNEISCGYAPFLSIICKVFRLYGNGEFVRFLAECGVYVPHREVLESYYRTGRCSRTEMVLLDEVEYEQRRMTEAIGTMLRKAAEFCPLLIVINRFQLASRSAMELVRELIRCPSANIGIVLGANEKPVQQENIIKCWDALMEVLQDCSHIYHIGNSEMRRSANRRGDDGDHRDFQSVFLELNNTTMLLDYDQASWYFQALVRRIRFEDEKYSDEKKMQMYPLYVQTSILSGDFARALEITEVLGRLEIPGQENRIRFVSEYFLAMCQMYQGKLEESYEHAKCAKHAAELAGSEKMKLDAELLGVQTKMAGWHNLLFCLENIEISADFLQKLVKYGYKNYLAHIYIYAFDNRPEEVARAYQSESEPAHFNRGVALAQEIGNERLVYNAYQKNIMIASTNGLYESALFYLMKNYQHEKDRHSMECGRTLSALGYNFSALGQYRLAEDFYSKALRLFWEIGLPEDIAEVHYNMSLNCILNNDFARAEYYLQLCMKAIEKLGMNSLRVCNLSKLYGLLAFVSIIQKDKFSCQRYLLNSGQFLDFVLNKERNKIETNHDYAKVDDDLFLYSFSRALLAQTEGNYKKACKSYQEAETFLAASKSNQFYIYHIFCAKRIELFRAMNRMDLVELEETGLKRYMDRRQKIYDSLPQWILQEISHQKQSWDIVTEAQLENLLKQESLTREIRNSRRQMEFLSRWQKLIDVNDVDIKKMVTNAMSAFLTHFGNDGALYIRYDYGVPRVIYSDFKTEITEKEFAAIERAMQEYPQGFAASKISGNFFEHIELLSHFRKDDVCSLAAVPFFKNGRLRSVVITFILMKGNWHSSMESYRISEGDLPVYQLLFREMGYSINRMEDYEKIYEMNQKLALAATTDMLTGLYNRTGLYQELDSLINQIRKQGRKCCMAVMFIDLDNFKHYNDTYGHNVGDIILVSMAQIFRDAAGQRGIVSRYGGDEYLIILEESDKTVLKQIAENIYQRLEASNGFGDRISEMLGHEVSIDDRHRITCSIGIAVNEAVSTEEDMNELIKKADKTLYSIKGRQKGTYAFLS